MIKLKTILKEDEVTDKFGNVAFGEDPKIADLQNKNDDEENTEFEADLLDMLYQWVASSVDTHDIQDDLYKIKNILKKAQGKFPEVFKPKTPNGTQLYRGLKWKPEKIASLINNQKSGFKMYGIPTRKGSVEIFWMYEKPIEYKPTGKVQSWSTYSSIAIDFSTWNLDDFDTDFDAAVLLKTKQNDEYIFNQDLMDILWYNTTASQSEEEILHFGKTYSEPVYLLISDALYKKYTSKTK